MKTNNIIVDNEYLFMSHNINGYYSIDSSGKVIFPYRPEENTLSKGFIKNIKIIKSKKSYAFFTADKTSIKAPTLEELSKFATFNSIILLPMFNSNIGDDTFILCKYLNPINMEYEILNVGIDDEGNFAKFSVLSFQNNVPVKYGIKEYCEYLSNIIYNVSDDLNIENNIYEYIPYIIRTGNYYLYDNRILIISDYEKLCTNFIISINNTHVIINIESLLSLNSDIFKDISDNFESFICNNYVTFNHKYRYFENDKYNSIFKISINNDINVYIPNLIDFIKDNKEINIKELFDFANNYNKSNIERLG